MSLIEVACHFFRNRKDVEQTMEYINVYNILTIHITVGVIITYYVNKRHYLLQETHFENIVHTCTQITLTMFYYKHNTIKRGSVNFPVFN